MGEGKGIDLYAENLTSIEKKLFLFSFFFFLLCVLSYSTLRREEVR